jgi:hypothetical protein
MLPFTATKIPAGALYRKLGSNAAPISTRVPDRKARYDSVLCTALQSNENVPLTTDMRLSCKTAGIVMMGEDKDPNF